MGMADGHRMRSDNSWALARGDYLSGLSAEEVCRRYDLGLSALRRRARLEGWRRIDQADPEVVEDDLDLFGDIDGGDLVEMARLRMIAAVARGRSAEAARWTRLYQQYRADEADVPFRRELAEIDARLAARQPPPRRATARLEGPDPVHELHELHSKILLEAPDAPISRQVRRRMERKAAKRS
jgi:hypothetical protein